MALSSSGNINILPQIGAILDQASLTGKTDVSSGLSGVANQPTVSRESPYCGGAITKLQSEQFARVFSDLENTQLISRATSDSCSKDVFGPHLLVAGAVRQAAVEAGMPTDGIDKAFGAFDKAIEKAIRKSGDIVGRQGGCSPHRRDEPLNKANEAMNKLRLESFELFQRVGLAGVQEHVLHNIAMPSILHQLRHDYPTHFDASGEPVRGEDFKFTNYINSEALSRLNQQACGEGLHTCGSMQSSVLALFKLADMTVKPTGGQANPPSSNSDVDGGDGLQDAQRERGIININRNNVNPDFGKLLGHGTDPGLIDVIGKLVDALNNQLQRANDLNSKLLEERSSLWSGGSSISSVRNPEEGSEVFTEGQYGPDRQPRVTDWVAQSADNQLGENDRVETELDDEDRDLLTRLLRLRGDSTGEADPRQGDSNASDELHASDASNQPPRAQENRNPQDTLHFAHLSGHSDPSVASNNSVDTSRHSSEDGGGETDALDDSSVSNGDQTIGFNEDRDTGIRSLPARRYGNMSPETISAYRSMGPYASNLEFEPDRIRKKAPSQPDPRRAAAASQHVPSFASALQRFNRERGVFNKVTFKSGYSKNEIAAFRGEAAGEAESSPTR